MFEKEKKNIFIVIPKLYKEYRVFSFVNVIGRVRLLRGFSISRSIPGRLPALLE